MASEGGYQFPRQRVRRRGATRGYNEAMGVRAYLFRGDRLVLEEAERICDVMGYRSLGTLLNAFLAHWVVDMKNDPDVKEKLQQRRLAVENAAQTYMRPKGYIRVGKREVFQTQAEAEAKRPPEAVVIPTHFSESEEEEARRLSREGTEETPL